MIAYLNGTVVSIRQGQLILNVSGTGYGVRVSQEDATHIRLQQSLELYIYEHIQEKAHDLYGFMSESAQDLFELLISINGVGPKAGLAILDLGPVDAIKQAIAAGNSSYVAGASGVGRKTAERVVVELKDKLSDSLLVAQATQGHGVKGDEALEALISLGYSQQQALQALSSVSSGSTEERIRQALKELA